jgi:acetyl-CoA carboxylase biotin carboxyl carrier protein
MDMKNIEQIADILLAKGLTAIETEEDGVRIRVEKNIQAVSGTGGAPASYPMVEAAAQVTPPQAGKPVRSDLVEVSSPLVGVVYLAPSPESPPYVSLGDRVERGQVLCIVEAMKMLNEIACPADGVIEEICVENEAVVDYGACLFRIGEV